MASSGSSSTSRGTFALGSLGSGHVSGDPWIASAMGSRQTCPPTTENGRDRPAGATVPRSRLCPKGHRLFVLLLWHTRGFSLLFSGKTVLCEGGGGGGGGGGWGLRGLGCGPLSSSSCRNGSRGALGLGLLQWLSHNNGLVPSAIEGWASLRFPFLFRYWRQIWSDIGMGVGELWGLASFSGFLTTMAWCLLPLRVGLRFVSLSFSATGGKYGPCSC